MVEQTINLNDNQLKPEDIYKCLDINDLPKEIWKDIPGYEGLYQVSNLGRVKSLERKVFYTDTNHIRVTPQLIERMRSMYQTDQYRLSDLSKLFGFRNSYISRLINGIRGSCFDGKKKSEKILRQTLARDGYLKTELSKNGIGKKYTVHRLVCIAFLLNQENKPEVNHINSIRADNRVENLEWCTSLENNVHAREYGNGKLCARYGEDNGGAKLNNEQVKNIRYLANSDQYETNELATMFNVSKASILYILNFKTWKNLK